MYLTIEDLLDQNDLDKAKRILDEEDPRWWEDGKTTAGAAASQVKINQQLNQFCPAYEKLVGLVGHVLGKNLLFNSFAVPKKIHSFIFSKTTEGGQYGEHVDNAFINGRRTDISFTIFLNNPDEYDGGYLVSEEFEGLKLKAGDAVLYPSSTLHEVTEVTSGTRLVCCGWVESRIKDPSQRDLLFDLNSAKMSMLANQGKTEEFDLVCKSHNNLLRMWSV